MPFVHVVITGRLRSSPFAVRIPDLFFWLESEVLVQQFDEGNVNMSWHLSVCVILVCASIPELDLGLTAYNAGQHLIELG